MDAVIEVFGLKSWKVPFLTSLLLSLINCPDADPYVFYTVEGALTVALMSYGV